MRVEIGKRGETLTDYTSRLLEDEEIAILQESERAAFDRRVDDVHLSLSNLDGFFTTLFASSIATQAWRVRVTGDTGRILFHGETDLRWIVFSGQSEVIKIDAFSLNKRFWELAKTSAIMWNHLFGGQYRGIGREQIGPPYTTVGDILTKELVNPQNEMTALFTTLDIDAAYINRPIRGWNVGGSTIGNEGMYLYLAFDTTIFELLNAMAFYYNAEFGIDPGTGSFYMKKRGSIMNDLNADLTGKMIDNTTMDIQLADSEKYDYIQTSMKLPKPPAATLAGSQIGTLTQGIFLTSSYFVTYVTQFVTLEIESDAGMESNTIDPPLNLQIIGGIWRAWGSIITLSIPTGPVGTLRRRIYRQSWGNSHDGGVTTVPPFKVGEPYQVGEIQDNVATVFYDGFREGQTNVVVMPKDRSGTVWFGYDESAKTWRDPVFGDIAPQGKILDVTPKLRFLSRSDGVTELPFSILSIVSFFGGSSDFNLSTFQNQWKDLFITRRLVTATFEGIDYRYGDSVSAPSFMPAGALIRGSKMRIRRCRNKLKSEISELELVTEQ